MRCSTSRGCASAPEQFTADKVYTGVSNTHNIWIDEDFAYSYPVGTNTCSGGPHMVDIREPKNPKFAACFATDGSTHDVQRIDVYPANDDPGFEGSWSNTRTSTTGSWPSAGSTAACSCSSRG